MFDSELHRPGPASRSEVQAHQLVFLMIIVDAIAFCVLTHVDVFSLFAGVIVSFVITLPVAHVLRKEEKKETRLLTRLLQYVFYVLTLLPLLIFMVCIGFEPTPAVDEAGWYSIDCAAAGGPGNIAVPEGHVNFVLGARWRVVQGSHTALPRSGSSVQPFSFVAPIEDETGACQTEGPIFAACVSSRNDTDLCSWDARAGRPNMRLLKASGVSGDAFWKKAVPNPQQPGSDVELTEHNVFQYNGISSEEAVVVVERERNEDRLKKIWFSVGWVSLTVVSAAVYALLWLKEAQRKKAARRRDDVKQRLQQYEPAVVREVELEVVPSAVESTNYCDPVPPPVVQQGESVVRTSSTAPSPPQPSRRAAAPTWS